MIQTKELTGLDCRSDLARRRMSREEINRYPIREYRGPVHIVRSGKGLAGAVKALKREAVLGFDIETKPAFRKGESYLPSLLQLAGEKEVYIFQLSRLRLPGLLLDILSDPGIIKAGVSLDYDISELVKLAHFTPAGFADLGEIAKRIGINNHGLRGLAAVLLGFRISKSAQKTNWARERLTPVQVRYAATDAWVGRELYKKLKRIAQ